MHICIHICAWYLRRWNNIMADYIPSCIMKYLINSAVQNQFWSCGNLFCFSAWHSIHATLQKMYLICFYVLRHCKDQQQRNWAKRQRLNGVCLLAWLLWQFSDFFLICKNCPRADEIKVKCLNILEQSHKKTKRTHKLTAAWNCNFFRKLSWKIFDGILFF